MTTDIFSVSLNNANTFLLHIFVYHSVVCHFIILSVYVKIHS